MYAKKAVRLLVASAMVVMFLGLVACSTTPISKSDKEQQQDSVRDMANKTLAQLYAKTPGRKRCRYESGGICGLQRLRLQGLDPGRGQGQGHGGEQRHQAGDVHGDAGISARHGLWEPQNSGLCSSLRRRRRSTAS